MKKKIVVLFGGQSSEHAVSCMSVQNVAGHINPEKYEVILVGITEQGRWLYVPTLAEVASDTWRETGIPAHLSPDATEHCLYVKQADGWQTMPVDAAFPVLHGRNGEDGTIQGLFELARIPYVGCGVLASAVSMDKLYTKRLVEPLGIRQAAFVPVMREELAQMEAVLDRVEEKIPYPVFVKPSRAGSSRGVSRAENREQLAAALRLAAEHDRKMLVEEMLIGREIECAVLDDGKCVRASGVGEVLAAAEFYDYDAKYNNPESKTELHPDFAPGVEDEIRDDALRIFRAVDGTGLARVDFFLTADGVVFNELNTMPGFTAISMYPMLWEERGLDKETLMETLIEEAFSREGGGERA